MLPRGPRGLIGSALAGGALFLGGVYLFLREPSSPAPSRARPAAPPKLETALAAAQEALKANPQDLKALVEVGTLLFAKGKDSYVEAVNALEEARELGALDPRVFYCLGIMYQELGLPHFALQEYRRHLRHYPDDKEIRMLAAKLLYRQGQFAEAVAEYERLKFHFPNDALVEENLGLSLWGAQQPDRAAESFRALAQGSGEGAHRARFFLGQIALEQNKPEDAVADLLAAARAAEAGEIGIAPERLYTVLASAHQKLDQLAEAKAAWEKVLERTPEDGKAKAAHREVSRRLAAAQKKAATARRS